MAVVYRKYLTVSRTLKSLERSVPLLIVAFLIYNLAEAQNRVDKGYVTVSDGPGPTKSVKPHYPDLARIARVQGDVVCEVIVGRNGKVDRVRILSGHPLLAKAAMESVGQWEWKPLVLGKRTYRVRNLVVIKFSP